MHWPPRYIWNTVEMVLNTNQSINKFYLFCRLQILSIWISLELAVWERLWIYFVQSVVQDQLVYTYSLILLCTLQCFVIGLCQRNLTQSHWINWDMFMSPNGSGAHFTKLRRSTHEICVRELLTLSQTSPGFYVSAVQVFWKHCGKGRNCS